MQIINTGRSYGNLEEFTTLPPTEPVLNLSNPIITDITDTSAVGEVTVLSNGGSIVTEAGMCWSTDGVNYHYVPSTTNNPTDIGTFLSKMEGLSPGTLYYVKGYAKNAVGTSYSSETSFITTGLPELLTLEPTEINGCSFISGGDIINNGDREILSVGVCWSVNPNPTIDLLSKTEQTVASPGLGEFESYVTGLEPLTKYYVRAYAVNEVGVAYGNEKIVETTSGKPEIITLSVTDITSIDAVSGGDILSNGGAPILKRGICWSDKGDPMDDPESLITNDGSGVGRYPSDIIGLLGSKKYYVRAYAENRYGRSYGNLEEFTHYLQLLLY